LTQVKDIQTKLADDPDQNFDQELRNLNSRIVVLENIYMSNESLLTPLAYCTTNFPEALHCDNCVNRSAKNKECYYVDTDKIKTSFTSGQVCLSYMAFPTDDDCYPLVPDDISYKEAMFWYIYKKMLLGGETPVNMASTTLLLNSSGSTTAHKLETQLTTQTSTATSLT